jgi:hypothetical protein
MLSKGIRDTRKSPASLKLEDKMNIAERRQATHSAPPQYPPQVPFGFQYPPVPPYWAYPPPLPPSAPTDTSPALPPPPPPAAEPSLDDIQDPAVFPLLQDWLKDLDDSPRADGIQYSLCVYCLQNEGYRRLFHLARLSPERLIEIHPFARGEAETLIMFALSDCRKILRLQS